MPVMKTATASATAAVQYKDWMPALKTATATYVQYKDWMPAMKTEISIALDLPIIVLITKGHVRYPNYVAHHTSDALLIMYYTFKSQLLSAW